MTLPDPFLYYDFRLWFREALANFSYSQVIVKLELKSKGHITQILQGKRNVPPHLAERIADLFQLTGRTREFVLALIEFTQAKSHEQKKTYLDRMVALQSAEGRPLSPLHYDLCKKWYYPVIRELVRILPVTDNFEELGKHVVPSITARAAETAIHDLERMGLIVRSLSGKYLQTHALLTFGEGWKSVVVREFQQQAVELQKQALDRFPAEEREIANSTICISRERAQMIKKKLVDFRQEIFALVQSDPNNSEQVFQLNIGFFPLSTRRKI